MTTPAESLVGTSCYMNSVWYIMTHVNIYIDITFYVKVIS